VLTEIRERPPSMLKNIDDGPLRGGVEDPEALTINAKKISMAPPLGDADGGLGAPTINAENINGGPPGPHGRYGLRPESAMRLINMHGYHRQK
jgi:hypothetical protein